MSLDTVLKIGKALRTSNNSLKHFRYVSAPTDKDGDYPLYIVIPIKKDYTFDFDGISIVPENERNNLYYLRYKTSDSDSSAAKYVYGDILYKIDRRFDKDGKIKKGIESGNYVISPKNAYENAKEVRKSYIKYFIESKAQIKTKKEQDRLTDCLENYISGGETNEFIDSLSQKFPIIVFWRAFYANKGKIEKILKYAPALKKSCKIEGIEDEYIKYLYEYKSKGIKKENKDKKIEKNTLLKYAEHEVFVHFRFEDNEQWYSHSAFKLITQMLNDKISSIQNENLIVPTKTIYRTLCSGNDKNDIQFPNFSFENSYKSFGFTNEQFEDFMYANSVLNTPKFWLKGTDINIFVFPAKIDGDIIDAEKLESFFSKKGAENTLFSFDSDDFDDDDDSASVKFDFVFANTGGNTTVDLIEISGIEKSQLVRIKDKITDAEHKISQLKALSLDRSDVNLSYEKSFVNILGCPAIEQRHVFFRNQVKKNGKLAPYAPYQSHMLKVLPLIFTETYFNDDVLLRKVIEKVEFSIRNGEEYGNFSLLKYDLMLINEIQNSKNNRYMEITQSESYGIGLLLGSLAKNLSLEINSFEKNYVGNLTRRISTIDDFIRLKNDIEQKLIMHDKSKYTFQTSYELAQKVKEFKSQYDKDECAFGFLESYFKPIPKSEISK